MAERQSGISRREFARRAALASAVGALTPVNSLVAPPASAAPSMPQQPPGTPKLSAEGQAESEARYEAILAAYGTRFTDEQKKDLRRLCYAAQPQLDRLRAYAVQNSDSPALYLDPIVEREKKLAAVVAPPKKS